MWFSLHEKQTPQFILHLEDCQRIREMDEEAGEKEKKKRRQAELGEIFEGWNPNTGIYSFASEVQPSSHRLSRLMETEDVSTCEYWKPWRHATLFKCITPTFAIRRHFFLQAWNQNLFKEAEIRIILLLDNRLEESLPGLSQNFPSNIILTVSLTCWYSLFSHILKRVWLRFQKLAKHHHWWWATVYRSFSPLLKPQSVVKLLSAC